MIDWIARLADLDRLLLGIAGGVFFLLGVSVFFAAVTIVLRLRNNRRRLVRGRLEVVWQPLVLGMLAGDIDAADVRVHVPPAHETFFVGYLLRFIERLIGEERARLRQLARPYLPRVVQQLGHRRPELRARAAQTIVLLGLEEYDDQVVRALDDRSTTVAMVAARALSTRRNAHLAPQILQRLHRFRQWNPRYLASMLSTMGSAVVPALRDILADPAADPMVRRVAADALFDLDDIASADDAAAAAMTSDDVELVAASIHLLARVGRPDHAPVARRALASANPLLRLRGAEALATIGGEEDLPRLRAAVEDASPWVAIAAASALAGSGGGALLESLARDPSPRGLLAREILGRVTAP
jgi:HEAT repeat protein